MHHDYDAPPLEQTDPDPIAEFVRWLDAARAAGVDDTEAMVLSTTAARARYVLVRGVDHHGFRFYTNYESAKAGELAADPRVALTFGWLALHRQVRIEGTAERLPDAESDAYFAGRPRGSQIGAWASPQSEPIDRDDLERRVAAAEQRFPDVVPRPPFWGGYLVRPHAIEFWQGRPSRLHDRLRYTRPVPAEGEGRVSGDGWQVDRLAP